MDITSLVKRIDGLREEMYEFSQQRSDFALDHFVVGQHDLPGRQRQQVLWELRALMFSLMDTQDEIELAEIDLEGLEKIEPNPRKRAIKKRQLLRKIEDCHLHLEGRKKEVIHLLSILDKMPRYTREQFDQEEQDYWALRLSRQHILARIGDPGNLDAFLQMYTTPGSQKPVIAGKDDVLAVFGRMGRFPEAHKRDKGSLTDGK